MKGLPRNTEGRVATAAETWQALPNLPRRPPPPSGGALAGLYFSPEVFGGCPGSGVDCVCPDENHEPRDEMASNGAAHPQTAGCLRARQRPGPHRRGLPVAKGYLADQAPRAGVAVGSACDRVHEDKNGASQRRIRVPGTP